MLVDLHFHLRSRKEDRIERLQNMVKRAQECGTRGIALLDHNYFPTDEELGFAREAAPLVTFWRACELDVKNEAEGTKEHVVVISENRLPFDMSHGIGTQDIDKLAQASASEDIVTMLAHPFRRRLSIAFDFNQFAPTLIDITGRTANQSQCYKVMSLAARWHMRMASSSDAHGVHHIGQHGIALDEDVQTVSSLKRALLASRYRLVSTGFVPF